jgi:hypothetical protein
MKKPAKTLSKTRDDILSVPAVWMSSAIYCVMREAILGVGGNQMSGNPVEKLLGTKVRKKIKKKLRCGGGGGGLQSV